MNAPVWMTSLEATEYLRLPSVEALYQAVRRGQIPCYQFGRRYRFNLDELDDAIRAGRALTLDELCLSS